MPMSKFTPKCSLKAAMFAWAMFACAAAIEPARAQQQPPNPSVRPPASAVIPATPGAPATGNEDADMWRKVRGGIEGQVSIPDKKSGVLVQSGGEAWRNFRNGPLPGYGAYAMGGMLALLALFYAVRGRIRIDGGWSGRTIQRFTDLERTGHWLMAVSFIILGLTGLNVLYGRTLLLPVLGKDLFASLAALSKWMHNYVAFAFMAGLALSFVMWLGQNFPNRHDVVWLLKGGGMFSRGAHLPAKKFNAGQKILFWVIMLGGVSISLSGLSLMFPFQVPLFAKTFAWANMLGLGLPTTLTGMQEMQLASQWHGIVALGLICVIFAHIYIGTVGMQGAFSAMGTGAVDVNWAKEHHSIWADEEILKEAYAPDNFGDRAVPAE